jgi:hypothetical protein
VGAYQINFERENMPDNSRENNAQRREIVRQIRHLKALKKNPHIKIKKVSARSKTGFIKVSIHGIDRPVLFFTGKSIVGSTLIEKNDLSEN